jgi:nucleoporin GLE1
MNSLEGKLKSSTLIINENMLELAKAAENAEAAAKAAAEAAESQAAADKAAAEAAATQAKQKAEAVEQRGEESPAPAPAASISTPHNTSVISVDEYRAQISNFKANYVVEANKFSEQEKKIKSALMSAISTALNAISAQTMDHLNDKLEKLTHLLAGRPVVMKDTICASHHPSGVKFCMAMAAKKIVRQGEDVVSSKAESAFPFASVALSLWDTFPDFGKLLLAYFFEFSPLLVPYYPRRIEGQSEKDYYLSLGYKYEKDVNDKDVIEKQDKYLKRMTGLARLFAGIAASNKPEGSNAIHPFGPKVVWNRIRSLSTPHIHSGYGC